MAGVMFCLWKQHIYITITCHENTCWLERRKIKEAYSKHHGEKPQSWQCPGLKHVVALYSAAMSAGRYWLSIGAVLMQRLVRHLSQLHAVINAASKRLQH